MVYFQHKKNPKGLVLELLLPVQYTIQYSVTALALGIRFFGYHVTINRNTKNTILGAGICAQFLSHKRKLTKGVMILTFGIFCCFSMYINQT